MSFITSGFKSALTKSVGAFPTTIYNTSSTSAQIIGLNLANTAGDIASADPHLPITVDVAVVRNGVTNYLANRVIITPGSATQLCGGELKMVLQQGDTLVAGCDLQGKCDVIVSTVESGF